MSSDKQPESYYVNKYLRYWGESPVPPTALATLILPQAVRPLRWLQLPFPPILLFGTWFNIMGAKADAAGITASWSALYLILSRRQKLPPSSALNVRRALRLGTQGTCMLNMLGCGYVYVSKKGFRLNRPDLPT